MFAAKSGASDDSGSGEDDAASTSTSRSRLLDDQIPEG